MKLEIGGELGQVTSVEEALSYLVLGRVEKIRIDGDFQPTGIFKINDLVSWIERAASRRLIPRLEWEILSNNPIRKGFLSQFLSSAEGFWERNELYAEIAGENTTPETE